MNELPCTGFKLVWKRPKEKIEDAERWEIEK